MTYISHARTPEELKAEVVSDLGRRIDRLDSYRNVVAKSAAEKARLECAQRELEEAMYFWKQLEIVRPIRKKHSKGAPDSKLKE